MDLTPEELAEAGRKWHGSQRTAPFDQISMDAATARQEAIREAERAVVAAARSMPRVLRGERLDAAVLAYEAMERGT